MLISTYNTPEVNFSITNVSVSSDEARDTVQPFSFLDFINYTKVDYSPEEYSKFYSAYIKAWYSRKELTQQEQVDEFKSFYINFIKEIILNFTTESERRFLSKIDYSNSSDLDIVLPFYANKIREIVIFYKNKRNEGKYVIDRNKIKGSTNGVERAIFDNIYNFLFGSQDTLLTSSIQLSSVITKLSIDIEEYIDVYGDYFDLPRSTTSESGIREELYSNNINNIDPSYYFDTDVIKTLSHNTLLSSIPYFYINPPPSMVDPVCDPNNPLLEQVSKQANIYNLKRQLISKYCGTDFYYIDTTKTTPTSGILFKAENPTNNLLNLQTADTATVESNQIKLLKDIGLFFKPNKQGLFKLTVDKSEYTIDTSRLEPDQIYVFPDPSSYGNVSTNAQSAYPISYRFDYRDGIRNISSGIASGDPYITHHHQTFNGYNTKERSSNNLIFRNSNGFKFNFSDLYNQGLLQKVQYDVFGNEYGLFKTDSLAEVTDLASTNILDLLLDGHLFFDDIEEYNFNYSTVDREGSTIRSGLTSFTNGFSNLENFWTLYFREFTPYLEFAGTQTPRNITPVFRDGAQFTFLNGDLLPDPLSSDDPTWPSNLSYYYSILADGAVDTPANFTTDIRYRLSAYGYRYYNCGNFTDEIVMPNDFNYNKTYRYLSEVDDRFATQLSTLTAVSVPTQVERKLFSGKLFVKNQRYSLSYPLSTAFEKTLSKYSQIVQDDINTNIYNFDIIRDIMVLETPSSLIIEKISYDNGEFGSSQTNNTIYNILSSNPYTKVSNRFFEESESKIYFTITNALDVSCAETFVAGRSSYTPKNLWKIVPEIYAYDMISGVCRKVFPSVDIVDSTDLTEFIVGSISEEYNFAPVGVRTPTITYNSTNNMFKVTYVVIDSNNQSHICDASFTKQDNALLLHSVSIYSTNSFLRTTTFNPSYSTFFASVSTTSGGYTIDQNKSIIVI